MFDDEFFPTPPAVASRMLDRVSPTANHFLEPSAGKGDLADAVKARFPRATVDCVERSPELVSVLLGKGYPVVGYDWLEYAGVSYYDAVLMNPPFGSGDEHLLKAWDFLHAGEIVCLLNEETVKNAHTGTRERLRNVIALHGEVEFLEDCFKRGERRTDVRVALVYLRKEGEDDSVDLWETGTQERAADDGIASADPHLPALLDRLGNLQHHYDQATEHMLKAFRHLRKAAVYLGASGISAGRRDAYERIAGVALRSATDARAEFVRRHRRDAWHGVFERLEFHRWLDKKQREAFLRDVERNGDIPFTKDNIKGTLRNVFLQRNRLFERSVANVFDELTSYFPGNTSHTEGWQSNDSYKVNRKVVFPWGCEFDPRFGFSRRYSSGAIDVYNDLDRVLCVLAGEDFEACRTVARALDEAFRAWNAQGDAPPGTRATSRFFSVRFFKKGTVHLVFRDEALWRQFNLTASAGKMWIGQET